MCHTGLGRGHGQVWSDTLLARHLAAPLTVTSNTGTARGLIPVWEGDRVLVFLWRIPAGRAFVLRLVPPPPAVGAARRIAHPATARFRHPAATRGVHSVRRAQTSQTLRQRRNIRTPPPNHSRAPRCVRTHPSPLPPSPPPSPPPYTPLNPTPLSLLPPLPPRPAPPPPPRPPPPPPPIY